MASTFGILLLIAVVAMGGYLYWRAEQLSQEIDRQRNERE
jgi:hypothetical protein